MRLLNLRIRSRLTLSGLLLLCVYFITPPLLADTADTKPLIAYLQSTYEVPPTLVGATGNAIVWIHAIRDPNNNITSGSIDFGVTFRFPGATSITGVDIHDAAADVNGSIAIPTDVSVSKPVVVDATGRGIIFRQVQFPSADGQVTVAIVQSLLDHPEKFYIDLHTTENPAGAARSQIGGAEMAVCMAVLSPANENPPITDSNASATVSFLVLRGTDPSGNFTTGAVIFDANYHAFPTDTMFTGVHIHKGVSGAIGPVVINTAIGYGANAVPVGSNGAGNLHYTVFATPDDGVAFQAEVQTINGLFENPNAFYADIHDVRHPAGEIRAQVRATDRTVFQVNMLSGNVTPPVTNSKANGTASIAAHTLRNADGSILAGAVVLDLNYRGFPFATTFTGLHVHDGPAGITGPIIMDAGISAANPRTSDTGLGNLYFLVTVDPGPGTNTLSSMAQTPENQYLDLHTTLNPNGALRSQVAPVNTAVPVIKAATSNPDSKTSILAPGEIMTIYGLNLSKSQADLSGFYQLNSLPVIMNGVTVMIGGITAPLYFVSPLQINAQVPFDVLAGLQRVVVKTTNGLSNGFDVTIAASAPAIYVYGTAGDGIIVQNGDFSLVTSDSPARAGDTVVIYLTGLGQTTPALQTGSLQQGLLFNRTGTVTVTIGRENAAVLYSIASPGFPGLYQVAVTVPSGVSGRLPVIVKSGTATSNTVMITVQ